MIYNDSTGTDGFRKFAYFCRHRMTSTLCFLPDACNIFLFSLCYCFILVLTCFGGRRGLDTHWFTSLLFTSLDQPRVHSFHPSFPTFISTLNQFGYSSIRTFMYQHAGVLTHLLKYGIQRPSCAISENYELARGNTGWFWWIKDIPRWESVGQWGWNSGQVGE